MSHTYCFTLNDRSRRHAGALVGPCNQHAGHFSNGMRVGRVMQGWISIGSAIGCVFVSRRCGWNEMSNGPLEKRSWLVIRAAKQWNVFHLQIGMQSSERKWHRCRSAKSIRCRPWGNTGMRHKQRRMNSFRSGFIGAYPWAPLPIFKGLIASSHSYTIRIQLRDLHHTQSIHHKNPEDAMYHRNSHKNPATRWTWV